MLKKHDKRKSAVFFIQGTDRLSLFKVDVGSLAAANPVPQQTQYAIVGDLCPECSNGDLDQATGGDGRWSISWYPVQCAVGDSNFVYSFQGSNPYYLKLQVANTRSHFLHQTQMNRRAKTKVCRTLMLAFLEDREHVKKYKGFSQRS